VYLVLDPLRKAVNVLRCFYGSSLRTGEDLEMQLRTVQRKAAGVATAAAVVLLFFGVLGSPVRAAGEEAPPAAVPAESKINSSKIDQSLNEVLQRREFSWRAPREGVPPPTEENTWFDKLAKDVRAAMSKAIKKFVDWISPERGRSSGSSGGVVSGIVSWLGSLRGIVIILVVLGAIITVVLLTRKRQAVVLAEPASAQPQPDLNQEDISPDQLPEDGWLALARELMQRGQLRLALRASYLAGLAHLGHRELIRLAKYKSNRDYDLELQRRARANFELLTAFGRNLAVFERAWYGDHEVTNETLSDFSHNLERIRAC
jgi:hypothetical protein